MPLQPGRLLALGTGDFAPETVEFTVYDRTDAAPVGTAGLLGIEHAHGLARFRIAIGDPEDFGASVLG